MATDCAVLDPRRSMEAGTWELTIAAVSEDKSQSAAIAGMALLNEKLMNLYDLDTPAVIVDLNMMDRNIRRLSEYCREHGLRLRPHVKTHKIPELALAQISQGAVGVTVAKLGEGEVMAAAGVEDILIAYPVYGEAKLKRLIALSNNVRLKIALDSIEVARPISDAAVRAGVNIPVLIEFDTGLRRCGLAVSEDSLPVVQNILALPGLEWAGVMVYPGHFLTDPESRERLLVTENASLREIASLLRSLGLEIFHFSGGSTPSAYMAHRFFGVNEIRPGTYIFNDRNTVECLAAEYDECALTVLSTVVSTSVPGRAVLDAGSKTLSGDRLLTGDGKGFGRVQEAPRAQLEALSEEHGHLNIREIPGALKVGDRVRIVPNHACPCVNLHETIYGVDGEKVVHAWKVAGRGCVR